MAITHLRSAHAVIILCDSCFTKITLETRMHCPTCIIDLCIPCFYSNTTNHPRHDYLLIEPLVFRVTNWPAIDDLLLFEGLELYGIGNWQDISEFINKSQDEIDQHFSTYFDLEPYVHKTDVIPLLSNPNTHEIVSFMPLRGDFDSELENDFETIFKELNIDPFYESLEDFRLELFDAFYFLQKRRAFYKFHIMEKGLFNMFGIQEKEANLIDWEQRILQRVKPMAQFLSKSDFNTFFSGLCIEEKLRILVEEHKKNVKIKFLEHEKKRSLFISDNEKDLCFLMRLSFKEYLKVKEIIVWDAMKTGFMDLKRAMALTGCYDDKLEIVINFFKRNEWI